MPETVHTPDFSSLNEHGLNLQAVFDWTALQVAVDSVSGLTSEPPYRQLLLIGHGGRRMWEAMQASEFRDRPDPVDSFSLDVVQRWLAETCPNAKHEIIYPAEGRLVPLQQLGALAGWHHASPFRIGINHKWGSWFAYRVALLIDSDWPISEPQTWGYPCEGCLEKPCVTACPAGAVSNQGNMLERCIDYRLQEGSSCAQQCLSRLACPVAAEHRYSSEQVRYHYEQSLQTIRQWKQGRGPSVP